MILRLVKMTFKPEETANFLDYFETIKDDIASTPGIVSLKIYQDTNNPNVVFTHSKWLGTSYLDAYRTSEIFGKVWPKTKALFDDKPMAWSLTLK
ncbi:MAG: antibiotic biosynthesis monooxygenase [Bacteroidia bacterium]|jgi:quinol monooxygenase YgiN|tara:strand:+ start:12169 stop:12453 length:285 start_codon:yes stop_codon:yes gene_type:complete